METSELIRLHRLGLRRRGQAEASIEKRLRSVRRLGAHLAPVAVLDADADAIETFLDTLPLKPKSRYTYISHLHCFYAWAIDAGHTDIDPTVRIVRPRFPAGQPRPISDEDLRVALDLAGPVERVVLTAAAYAGMRCCEIARLARDDIGTGPEPHIRAQGKGDKVRHIPLHPELYAALQVYGIPRNGPILRRPDGRPMPAWKVSHTANRYLHSIGIDATAHQLRHWFASKTYRSTGHNLLLVSKLLGHSSVVTTQIYADCDRDGAYAAVAALTPA
jgi:integrase/recombinase XerC